MSTPQIHRALAEAMRVLAVAEHEGLPMPTGIDVSTTAETHLTFARIYDVAAWAKWLNTEPETMELGRMAYATLHTVVASVRVQALAVEVTPAAVA